MPHFIDNRKQYVRLFKNPLSERLTHGKFWLPAGFYLPVIGGSLLHSFQSLGAKATLGFFLFGLLFMWSLSEYILHRWAFHFTPRTPAQQQLQFQLHGVHHDYPRDLHRKVIPLPFSLAIATLTFVAYSLVFGPLAPAIFAGFLLGYLAYDYVHWLTHEPPRRNRILRFLRSYHLRHHYEEPDSAYGVTSPVWDWVFGTLPTYLCPHPEPEA